MLTPDQKVSGPVPGTLCPVGSLVLTACFHTFYWFMFYGGSVGGAGSPVTEGSAVHMPHAEVSSGETLGGPHSDLEDGSGVPVDRDHDLAGCPQRWTLV